MGIPYEFPSVVFAGLDCHGNSFSSVLLVHKEAQKGGFGFTRSFLSDLCSIVGTSSPGINIAKSAYFSSDRTIREYANEIWHTPCK